MKNQGLILYFLISVTISNAQNISGKWEGRMRSNNVYGFQTVLEIEIEHDSQTNEISGIMKIQQYSPSHKRYGYTNQKFSGVYGSNKININATENISSGPIGSELKSKIFDVCLMSFDGFTLKAGMIKGSYTSKKNGAISKAQKKKKKRRAPKEIVCSTGTFWMELINAKNFINSEIKAGHPLYSSPNYISGNIEKRGYRDATFLMHSGNKTYYSVKKELNYWDKGKFHDLRRPTIIVIHKVGENENLLKIRKIDGPNKYEYTNPLESTKFFEENLSRYYPNATRVDMLHFAENNFFEMRKPFVFGYGIELPIIKSYYSRNVSKGWNAHVDTTNKNYLTLAEIKAAQLKWDTAEKIKMNKIESYNNSLIEFFKKNGYPYKDGDFFVDNFKDSYNVIQNVYNGDYDKLDGGYSNAILYSLIAYVKGISDNCRHLVPKNAIPHTEKWTVKGGHDTSTIWITSNIVQTTATYVEDKDYEYTAYVDPKFYDTYLVNKKAIVDNGISVSTIYPIYEYFRSNVDCDRKFLELLGENLLRYSKEMKSVQQEQGLFKN